MRTIALGMGIACIPLCGAALEGCSQEPSQREPSEEARPVPSATSAADTPPRTEGAVERAPASPPPAAPASEWDLALAVLDALKARDTKAFVKLIVDEKEFKEVIYPDLPAYDPSRPHVADFNWGFVQMNSLSGLSKVMDRHGGLEVELLDVIPTGGVEERKGYRLHKDIDLKVRTKTGEELTLNVLGSVVQIGDRYKLMGFRT